MIESMDMVFLVDISSTCPFFSTVTCTISSMINPLIKNNYNIRLASTKTRSNDHYPSATTYSFTESIVDFKHWLVTDHTSVEQHSQSQTMSICDALRETLTLDWRTMNKDRCHENIVFLITDDLPCRFFTNPTVIENDDCLCACDDLWTISNEFVQENLTLVIVGVGPIVSICDHLYGAIAKNTGGEYIPLTNASRILFWSIQSIITQGFTLSQSLRHIKHEEFERNSSYHHSTIQTQGQSRPKHYQMMAEKGAWLLTHYQIN